jgi:polyhydroxyalkanoate synthesis regulator phasin
MSTILIPPPRIPVIDQRTGMMAQAWYAFFSQFLQGLSNDVDGATVDLTALTLRVLGAETDVDALQAEDGNLFVDLAMQPVHTAEIDELRKRVTDLETDYRPDPTASIDANAKRIADLEADYQPDQTAAIDELRKRITDLETELSMSRSPLAAIEELRKRVTDLETDMEMA